MPTFQYVRHALHCDFGSMSTISHSSVFPAALIASSNSLLKGLNARCCWKSLWSACRWRWFSICWIKLWMLMPCDRPSRLARLRCCSRCFPRRLQGWTCSRLMMQCHNVREKRILALCVCDSTGFTVLSWACMTRFSSHFTGFPVLLEVSSSFCKHLKISREQDVFSRSTSFTVKTTIGLFLDWVGLEDSARGASPKDCWTNFPTGWCSIVDPNWSFPLVQLWSCFNEIIGGGRGDKYGL